MKRILSTINQKKRKPRSSSTDMKRVNQVKEENENIHFTDLPKNQYESDSEEVFNSGDEKDCDQIKKDLYNLDQVTKNNMEEIEKWKKQAKMFEDNLKIKVIHQDNYLSEVISDVEPMKMTFGGKKKQEDDIISINSHSVVSVIDSKDDVKMQISLETEEDRKKYFMSLAFNIKFKYSEKQIKQNMNINELFTIAKDNGIPPDDWYLFIYSSLVNEG